MKRIFSALLVVVLVFTMLAGCSSRKQTTGQKTEEELKAEVKAEMEAEARMKEELRKEIRSELEVQQKAGETASGQSKPNETSSTENKQKEDAAKNDARQNDKAEADSPIVLSVLMNKDEIINKLGKGYTFETKQEEGYFTYCSSLKYEGITFDFNYDTEELPEGKAPDNITITSDKYVFNYDFKVGEPAQKALDYCEKNFKHAYDMHMGQDIFDAFMYKEKKNSGETADTNMVLRWEYDKEGDFSSKSEVPADAGIKSVQLFIPID
jgi:hypothetical protein